jgi:hypothetical protein
MRVCRRLIGIAGICIGGLCLGSTHIEQLAGLRDVVGTGAVCDLSPTVQSATAPTRLHLTLATTQSLHRGRVTLLHSQTAVKSP